MEDTGTQEAAKIAIPVLTTEDQSRIMSCDFYQEAKRVIASTIEYKEFEVGTAVFIKRKSDQKFVGTDSDGKNPDKYIIVKNDEGFVFAKRINANGKPGVAITCLTIDYGSYAYDLQVDDGYVEAMLLDTQEAYDPLSDAKSLMKKKTKSARENSKNRLLFDTNAEAYAFIKNMKIGDRIYESEFLYGTGITEYVVDSIEIRPAIPPSGSGWSRNRGDETYTAEGFKDFIRVNLKSVSSTKRYSGDRKIEFNYLSRQGWTHYFLYLNKPLSPDDIVT